MDSHDSYQANLPARLASHAPPAVAAERPASAEAGRPLNVRIILRGLARYWWQILLMWAVTSTALVAVIYLNVKPTYEAVALLQAEPVNTLFETGAHGGEVTFLQTQVDLIKSTSVLSVALLKGAEKADRIRRAEDPTLELRSALDIVVRPNTWLIQVSSKAADPKDATNVVNAVVNAYIEVNKLASAERLTIENLETFRKELGQQEEKHSKLWKEKAIKITNAQLPRKDEAKPQDGEPKGERLVQAEEFWEVKAALRKYKADLIDAEFRLALLNAQDADDGGRPSIDDRVRDALQADAGLRQMKFERKKIVARIEQVAGRSRQKEYDAAARRLVAEKDRLSEQIEEETRDKARAYRASFELGAATVQGRDLKGEARGNVALLKMKIRAQEEELKKIDIKEKLEAGDSVDIFMAQKELENIQAMKQSVSKRLEGLKYEAKGVARIRVADVAVAPRRPSSNSRPKLLLATPVVVLGALMSLFVLLEIRSGRIGHPDELSPRMRSEVFAVPPLPTLRSSRGRGRNDQVEEFTQRVDHLRVALCGEARDGVARCILITSAAGGEGKTTLASQLAGRCANAGLSTLLIDADLRRPRLGQLLDVPEGPGLSDVLSGDAEVEAALVVIGNAGGFHLLPAGTAVADPSRILRGHRLGDLIGRLRRTFDIVILDTPPVLPVPDALTMGVWADGAVLAVRRDASRVSLVERASRMLSAAGLPILGVVVNGVRTADMGYGGYSGYASYASTAVATVDYAAPAATSPEI